MLALIFSIPSIFPAHAGLDAPINLDNPRVVPIWGAMNEASGAANFGWWSGYLYSSRIVFTAAHSTYSFDNNNNNRILNEPPFILVGKPNSNPKDGVGSVKVIKKFVGDYKLGKVAALNDFIVYVLEKDLIPMQPSRLMTTDIEKELTAAKSEINFHGYGEYRDRCAPGEKSPCKKDWNNPNQSGSELPRLMKITLNSLTDFSWMSEDHRAELQFETLVSKHKGCSGDSGGPITTTYKGDILYLGQGLNGSNVYACGAGSTKEPKVNDLQSYGYFSPVYKHLELLKEAEAFVAQQAAAELKAKQEAEAKAATELKAKQEAEAKAAAELKAKAAAELKAKQEADAKAAATTKTTITCTKGKLIKKVTAVKPKCPVGYKVKR